jgi:hypothetical protein
MQTDGMTAELLPRLLFITKNVPNPVPNFMKIRSAVLVSLHATDMAELIGAFVQLLVANALIKADKCHEWDSN